MHLPPPCCSRLQPGKHSRLISLSRASRHPFFAHLLVHLSPPSDPGIRDRRPRSTPIARCFTSDQGIAPSFGLHAWASGSGQTPRCPSTLDLSLARPHPCRPAWSVRPLERRPKREFGPQTPPRPSVVCPSASLSLPRVRQRLGRVVIVETRATRSSSFNKTCLGQVRGRVAVVRYELLAG